MFPQFKNIDSVRGKELKFTVDETECFFTNCLRRSVIADVNTVAFPEFAEESSHQVDEKRERKKNKLFLSLYIENLLEQGSILNYSPGFITIHENTTNFHNEIIMKRLSLIPIYLSPLNFLSDPSKYTFSLNVTHDTLNSLTLLDVTTADIKFHTTNEEDKEENKEENNEEDNEENKEENKEEMDVDECKTVNEEDKEGEELILNSIFPPFIVSLEKKIFENVKAKIPSEHGARFSDETTSISTFPLLFKLLPGQTLRITMRPSVSSSFFHAAYNPVARAYYTNTLHQERILEKLRTYDSVDTSDKMIIKEKEDFDCHDKHRYFVVNERKVASSFNFVLESIGCFTCQDILEVAFQTILSRLSKMKKQLSLKQMIHFDEKDFDVCDEKERTFYHCTLRIPEVYPSAYVANTKFHMNNGHTIANLIHGVLYTFYTCERKDNLVLVSYRKPSPLDIRQDHDIILDSEVNFPHALDPHIEYLFVWGIEKDAKPITDHDALEKISSYIEYVKEYVEGAYRNFLVAIEKSD